VGKEGGGRPSERNEKHVGRGKEEIGGFSYSETELKKRFVQERGYSPSVEHMLVSILWSNLREKSLDVISTS